jgi:NADPH:quinone reductase-like Zn-dependent oxidoreductase
LVFGIRKPSRVTTLGQEFAGEVVAMGKDVTRFQIGDQIYGSPGFKLGSYAEYNCLPEKEVIVEKPSSISFDEAACITTGGLNALHFHRKANIQKGQKVLFIGAGGSIGTFGIQLAKSAGAVVTAVDSTGKLVMLQNIGADRVIDYTKEDFTKNGETYDVIIDIVCKRTVSDNIGSLKDDGTYIMGNPRLGQKFRARWKRMTSNKKIIFELSEYRIEDLNYLNEQIEKGKIKIIIDRRFPLKDTAEAHRYVESGRKKGNVVINVVPEPE